MEIQQKCFLRAQKKNVQGSQSPKVPKREPPIPAPLPANLLEGKCIFIVEGPLP